MAVDVEERDAGIVIVRMDWPEKRNALGPDDTRVLGEALHRAGAVADVGVILTGVGAFCAGGDLEQFAALSAATDDTSIRSTIYDNVHSVLRSIRSSPVPVVAAVDGPALGLGLDYALACDMCFIGSKGWLQQAWALAGLVHGAGGSGFIQRTSGSALWKLIAEQPRIDGPAGEELGLAEAADGQALDAAVARLETLGQLPREVLEAYTSLFRSQRWPDDSFFAASADHQARFIASAAFQSRAEEILRVRAAART